MGTIAETANATYRLSFAEQGKQLPFSVFRVYLYIEVAEFVDIYIYIYINIYLYIYINRYLYLYIYILQFQMINRRLGDFP
jgi:hypothetical protein